MKNCVKSGLCEVIHSSIGVVRGGKGVMPPQIFRKYSHFVL